MMESQDLISTEIQYLGLGHQNSVHSFNTAFCSFSSPHFEGFFTVSLLMIA